MTTQGRLLQQLASAPGLTRKELAARCQMPLALVMQLTDDLLNLGLIGVQGDRLVPLQAAPVSSWRLSPEALARVRMGQPSDGLGPRYVGPI